MTEQLPKNLQWLKDRYKYLSIYDIESDLKLPTKTLYKFVRGERTLPEKYHKEVIQWINEFKKDSINNRVEMKPKANNRDDFAELYNKALKGYLGACKRKNIEPVEPSLEFSQVDGDLVFLRNDNSLIATYNHRKERFVNQ